ncbi:putative glucosamine 6-phosphate N-acetyltransferase [Trichinella pseudospiralis]|uniref:glucosamine-phosphate N-acetyltransferase n=1 Tax=Trichinella pseudospiralis TaxID=6337 RepID=A0A0V1E4Z5_TRIPS|nr:putative glucosamine 6-phosphate N-acetyltransferase [Trichinella pseudospiralis]KRY68913.1 putative glucosamine 6-phosphate N-acetyltransferase [Trichinella pseudospiralis]KRZ28937.1 putative glucosamine 6-phosphate N-acetyltransferase [Trichinella pseudospiralis]KRZ37172.1 putative glucosamine 6-phosphate N-acetyltransferase [Trichinella pseudospiralis]
MSEFPEQSVAASVASSEKAGPNGEKAILVENRAAVEENEAERELCKDGTLSSDMESSELPSLALMEIGDSKYFAEGYLSDCGAGTGSKVDSDDGDDFMTLSEVRRMAMKQIREVISTEFDSDNSETASVSQSDHFVSVLSMSLTRDSMTDSFSNAEVAAFLEEFGIDSSEIYSASGKSPFFSATYSSDDSAEFKSCHCKSFPTCSVSFEEDWMANCTTVDEENTALEMTEFREGHTSEEEQHTESSSEVVLLMDGECSKSERHSFAFDFNFTVRTVRHRSNENSFCFDSAPGVNVVSALLLYSKLCVDLLNSGEMKNFESVHQTKDEDVLGENLFDCSLLDLVDLRKATCSFTQVASVHRPADNLCVRPLQRTDFEKGFLQLLSRLTHVGSVSKGEFCRQFVEMRNCQGTYYVVVIEDLSKSIIVGTCMLVIERKFIHSCGSRARLEDLVVDTAYRGKQLGKLLIEVTRQLAWNLGCYKVSLECKDELISYYEQFGFNKEIGNGNFLVQRQY